MKTLCIALFALVTTVTTSLKENTETMVASFAGYENEAYRFIDGEAKIIEFQALKAEAKEKYNLEEGDFKGKPFTITYETSEEGNSKTIVDLELVDSY